VFRILRRLGGRGGPVIPAVRLEGAVGMGMPGRRSLTLAGVAGALDRAFSIREAPVVALVVNSPGGSPVQSHLIHRRIRSLAEAKGKRVVAFVEDAAASGGYMIACAADEIVADPASLVGSIGVAMQGFGFTGLMERIGVERRLHVSGEDKGFLDPFRPERAEDVAHLESLQGEIHAHFIALVRARRGGTLATDEDLFTGLVWTGQRAVALGLVDGLGELRETLRARHGEKVDIRVIEPARASLLRRAFFGAARAAGGGAAAALEERALWARLGR